MIRTYVRALGKIVLIKIRLHFYGKTVRLRYDCTYYDKIVLIMVDCTDYAKTVPINGVKQRWPIILSHTFRRTR
jgi:hypothetical protein